MLDNALAMGISEFDFWNMTIAELNRLCEAKEKIYKREAQERATYDYIHANLIVRGVANVFGGTAEYPTLEQAYKGLFEDTKAIEEQKAKKQELKMALSAIRFKQYANFHNKKYE